MATIRKRGNSWQAQVRVSGKPPRSKSFKSKRDAQHWSIKTHQELLELEPHSQNNDVLVKDILTRYRDNVIVNKISQRVETSMISHAINDELAGVAVSALTHGQVCQFRDRRLRHISPTTLARELGILRHAWKVAHEEWGLTPAKNPFAAVRLPKSKGPRERRLRHGELKQILHQANKQSNPYVKYVIMFALETAMRGSEILKLKWSDIDSDQCIARITKSKNASERRVPLTSRATRILLHLPSSDEKNVFPISISLLKQAWKRMLSKTDIVDLHFHDLRHEAISRFIDGGLTVPEVAAISGHKDSRSLLRYAHPSPERLREKFMNLEGLSSIPECEMHNTTPNVLEMNLYFRKMRLSPNRNSVSKHDEMVPQSPKTVSRTDSLPRKILQSLAYPFLLDGEDIDDYFIQNRALQKF